MKLMRSAILVSTLSIGLTSLGFAAGDASVGQAKAAACGACHGADGNSFSPMFPKIAGQGESYLLKQLKDFQSGARSNAMMAPMVMGKSEQDLADISAYFASKTASAGQSKADLAELGEKIYRGGNLETGVAACTACHGPKGKGVTAAGFPALQGQWSDYIAAQLKAFRAAGRDDNAGVRRDNDGEARMMRDVAGKLSDKEIDAVSSFISGLK
ncbi:MAG: cytochrome c4 [Gammaproteobacteria bacterium]|nr:cytochrome c4 [Gammaproteobacteria bacterium]